MVVASQFVAISLEEIEDRVIAYFARRFKQSPNSFFATTDLKSRFNFTDAAWAGLAETFSAMPWMEAIHVRLAQVEMVSATTVEKLTFRIWRKVPRLIPRSIATVSAISLNAALKSNEAKASPKSISKKKKRQRTGRPTKRRVLKRATIRKKRAPVKRKG